MKTVARASFIVAVVALLIAAVPVSAQEQSPAQGQASIAQGQLVRVDPTAKVLVIKDAQGAETQFRYTDRTKVSGAGETVAGIATMAGAQVTVHFTKEQKENVATEIEVQKKS